MTLSLRDAWRCFVFALLLTVFGGKDANAQDYPGLEHVTGKTFKSTIAGDGYTLVFFYAPWCPACKQAKPEYIAAANKVKQEMNDRLMVAVNCDEEQNAELCASQNIQGYPTVKLFQKGVFVGDFPDAMTQEQFYTYLKEPPHVGEFRKPSSPEQAPVEESTEDTIMKGVKYLEGKSASKDLKEVEHAMVFFYAPWCPHCSEAKPKFEAAALALNEKKEGTPPVTLMAMNCDDAKNQDFCAEQQVEGFPTLKYFHHGEMYAEFEDEIETKNILEYLKTPPKEKKPSTPKDRGFDEDDESMSVVANLNESNFTDVTKKTLHCVVMFYTKDCKGCHDGRITYNEAAEVLSYSPMENKLIAAVNCEEESGKKVCEKEKVTKLPLIRYYSLGKLVEDFPRPLTINDVMEYVGDLGKEKKEKEEKVKEEL